MLDPLPGGAGAGSTWSTRFFEAGSSYRMGSGTGEVVKQDRPNTETSEPIKKDVIHVASGSQ